MTTYRVGPSPPYFSSSPLASSAPTQAGGRNNVCVIDDELTPQDTALVVAAEGGVNLPNGKINVLAMEIALDRYTGHLQGSVTASYIENVANSEKRDNTDAIPQSVLSKALQYLAGQTGTAPGGSDG
jgi:hypothetical protein